MLMAWNMEQTMKIKHPRKALCQESKDARSMALLANQLVEQAKSLPKKDPNLNNHIPVHLSPSLNNNINGDCLQIATCDSSSSFKDQSNSQLAHTLEEEAEFLAKKSMELDPDQSIAYAVLSTIPSYSFQERMNFLQKAVDLERKSLKNGKSSGEILSSHVAIALSLPRLLVEPREDEDFRLRHHKTNDIYVSKSSPSHPLRRDLSAKEKRMYEDLVNSLEIVKKFILKRRRERQTRDGKCKVSGDNGSISKEQKRETLKLSTRLQYISKANYRLGILFRTMNPRHIHRPSSQYHFRSAIELLHNGEYELENPFNDLVIKSKFWLATFQSDNQFFSSDQTTQRGEFKDMSIDRCPPEYIVSLYSSFATSFDDLLVKKLKYKTPTKLRLLLDKVLSKSHMSLSAKRYGVDLGCGTGLSGIAIRDLVDHLTGVDLSPEMIDKARERGCYDTLHVGDVESLFNTTNAAGDVCAEAIRRYDLVTACDVFVYVGDLRSIFQTVFKYMERQHGLFAFSTELWDEEILSSSQTYNETNRQQYILQQCARFAHKQSYIRNLAEQSGFDVLAMETEVIRRNGGKDVRGTLAVLSPKSIGT